MSSRNETVNSNSKITSEDKRSHYNNHTENITEFPRDQNSVEPNTNPMGNTQQNPLQIPDSSYFICLLNKHKIQL